MLDFEKPRSHAIVCYKSDLMKILEIFGLIIIALITTAFLTTPTFFTGVPLVMRIEILCMLVPLVLMAGITIRRLVGNRPPLPIIFILVIALILYMTSSVVFFTNENYFWHGATLPLSFWHRVSFYTLPAITLESALVTLFVCLIAHPQRFTKRELVFISRLFYGYTLTTMIVNFMVIGNAGITVTQHLFIAKAIIIGAGVVTIGVLIKGYKKNTILHK